MTVHIRSGKRHRAMTALAKKKEREEKKEKPKNKQTCACPCREEFFVSREGAIYLDQDKAYLKIGHLKAYLEGKQ